MHRLWTSFAVLAALAERASGLLVNEDGDDAKRHVESAGSDGSVGLVSPVGAATSADLWWFKYASSRAETAVGDDQRVAAFEEVQTPVVASSPKVAAGEEGQNPVVAYSGHAAPLDEDHTLLLAASLEEIQKQTEASSTTTADPAEADASTTTAENASSQGAAAIGPVGFVWGSSWPAASAAVSGQAQKLLDMALSAAPAALKAAETQAQEILASREKGGDKSASSSGHSLPAVPMDKSDKPPAAASGGGPSSQSRPMSGASSSGSSSGASGSPGASASGASGSASGQIASSASKALSDVLGSMKSEESELKADEELKKAAQSFSKANSDRKDGLSHLKSAVGGLVGKTGR